MVEIERAFVGGGDDTWAAALTEQVGVDVEGDHRLVVGHRRLGGEHDLGRHPGDKPPSPVDEVLATWSAAVGHENGDDHRNGHYAPHRL